MSSLSDELLKLTDLFSNGSLSEEEFKASKEATIRRHALQTSASTSTLGRLKVEVQNSTGNAPCRKVDVSRFGHDEDGKAQRERAYTVLETILQNLKRFPAELKYRRLRLNNPALQSQLFSVPGVVDFLGSIGFVSTSGMEDGDEWLQLLDAPHPTLLEEALDAIHLLRRQGQEIRESDRSYMRLRQRLSLEVRRERCERAKAVGELRSYLAREFCADDAGDGLYTSAANLETLRVILTNVSRYPTELKYRRLRLGNPTVSKCILQQRGGLELLLECAGAEIVEEANGEGFLVFREGDGGFTEEKVSNAIWVLDELQSTVQAAREELQRQEREDAERAMRMEMRSARHQEERRYRLQQKEEEQLEKSITMGEHHSQRRIPISEAVQFLLGRNINEED